MSKRENIYDGVWYGNKKILWHKDGKFTPFYKQYQPSTLKEIAACAFANNNINDEFAEHIIKTSGLIFRGSRWVNLCAHRRICDCNGYHEETDVDAKCYDLYCYDHLRPKPIEAYVQR